MELSSSRVPYSTYTTKFGKFGFYHFSDGIHEAIVLTNGDIQSKSEVFLRVQTECIHHTLFCSEYCDCERQIEESLKLIKSNKGLLILLKQENNTLLARFIPNEDDLRNYEIVLKILKDHFDIKSIKMISINKKKIKILEKLQTYSRRNDHGFIKDKIWYRGRNIIFDKALRKTVDDIKKNKVNRPIKGNEKALVLVIGDLNVDKTLLTGGQILEEAKGSGFNAWLAFGKNHKSILFGKVGSRKKEDGTNAIDDNGEKILSKIEKEIGNNDNLYALIGIHESKKTCEVTINRNGPGQPLYYEYDHINANDYDVNNLEQALTLIDFCEGDYIYISSYLFYQYEFDLKKCCNFFKILNDVTKEKHPKVVVDIAQYMVTNRPKGARKAKFTINELNSCLNNYKAPIHAVIAEYSSLKVLIDKQQTNNLSKQLDTIPNEDITLFMESIKADYIICRYGYEGVKKQSIIRNCGEITGNFVTKPFLKYPQDGMKIGFGDLQAVKALEFIRNHG